MRSPADIKLRTRTMRPNKGFGGVFGITPLTKKPRTRRASRTCRSRRRGLFLSLDIFIPSRSNTTAACALTQNPCRTLSGENACFSPQRFIDHPQGLLDALVLGVGARHDFKIFFCLFPIPQ